MFKPLICFSSHHNGDKEEDDDCLDSQSSPKRSKKGNSRSNPYADRGLDKFSALLARIESKKRKIYTQVGADEISIVRFVFSSSPDSKNDVVKPIVVKLKPANNTNITEIRAAAAALTGSSGAQSDGGQNNGRDGGGRTAAAVKEGGKERLTRSVSWKKMKWEDFRKPRFYLPFTVVMILVFLAIYGRAFAIWCTSVGWYAIPAARGSPGSPGGRRRPATPTVKMRSDRNKEYVRRFSEKNLMKRRGDDGSPSPKSGGLTEAAGRRHRRKCSL